MAVSVAISALTALGAAPATNDLIPLVDISDLTQSASGTTKSVTTAFLFTTPTFATSTTITGGTVTVSTPVLSATQTWNAGGVTFTGIKLNVTDTASAAASLLVDLQVGGASKFSVTKAGLANVSGTAFAGVAYQNAGTSKWLLGRAVATGSGDAFELYNSTLTATALSVATATSAITLASTLTGTRLIGGTDITSAVATVVSGTGTALGSNDVSIANVLGVAASITTASSSGTIAVGNFAGKQTAATTGALDVLRGVAWMAHTSGTVVLGIGVHGTAQADGNGGTTTALDCGRFGNFSVGTGAVVTTLRGLHVTSGANTGTLTNHIGLEIDNVALGATTNYAIKTNGGNVLFASLPTSSAGLAAGTVWSNSGVLTLA